MILAVTEHHNYTKKVDTRFPWNSKKTAFLSFSLSIVKLSVVFKGMAIGSKFREFVARPFACIFLVLYVYTYIHTYIYTQVLYLRFKICLKYVQIITMSTHLEVWCESSKCPQIYPTRSDTSCHIQYYDIV